MYAGHPLFTNRVSELRLLQQLAEDLTAGQPRHVALFGLRRIGKTLLLMEIASRLQKVRPVYMSFEEMASSPELFAERYVGFFCHWIASRGDGDPSDYLSLQRLLSLEVMRFQAIRQAVSGLLREFDKAQPDQSAVLRTAFDLPERWARESGEHVLMLLDEFQELLTFDRFAVKNTMSLFRAVLNGHRRVSYIAAGSAMSVMQNLVERSDSPLFMQLEKLQLQPFDKRSTTQLLRRLGVSFTPAEAAEVQKSCAGYPFYVTAVARRLRRLEGIDTDRFRHAFNLELTSSDGQIYAYCKYLYDLSLQRARGWGNLKAVLDVLSQEAPLTVSEIARRVHRSAPSTAKYVEALEAVDLLGQTPDGWQFQDPVFRSWVALQTHGLHVEGTPEGAQLRHLLKLVEERLAAISEQLGTAQESRLRELLRGCRGQRVPGQLLGLDGIISLPHFKTVEPYRSSDGQVEIDALARNGETWVCEVKWRTKLAGSREIEALHKKATALAGRGWFISKPGFTIDARRLARRYHIMVSDEAAFLAVEKHIQTHPPTSAWHD